MRRLLTLLAGLMLLAVLAAGTALFAIARYNAPGPLPATRAVVVPRGAPAALAEQLAEIGVIDGTVPFRVAAFITSKKGPLRAGEFTFPEHASLFAVLTILRSGKPVQHRITIPEGLTAVQIAQIFDRTTALDGDTPMPGEGEALPQTYAFTFGTPRAAVLDRARSAMERALAQAWAARAPGLPISTPQEMLTLASIVERETARPEERAHIAAVFLNRLKRGMRLQSDPTVAYAVSGGLTTSDRSLTRAELDQPNPYNTYTTAGLPPGPIDSPGVASLQAVSRPLASDDLYFVADGTGGHVFANNLDEHNRNVARWRASSAHP
jgi:UPF0755 protein